MIMARNEDGTYSQVGFVKDNAGIDTEYIYDKDGDIVFEKGFTRETSGTVPLTINGIGKDLKDWSITGNTVQSGTPTPDSPIMPQGTGERTGNLADTLMGGISANDGSDVSYNPTQSQIRSQYIPCTQETNYVISSTQYPAQNFVAFYDVNKNYLSRTSGIPLTQGRIFTTPANAAYMRATFVHATDEQLYPYSNGVQIMLNTGSTALPYEPYGYKIPVVTSTDGTEPITTPIYLPTPLYSAEVMRSDGSRDVKFGKLVLTGEEAITVHKSFEDRTILIRIPSLKAKSNGIIYCTHLQNVHFAKLYNNEEQGVSSHSSNDLNNLYCLISGFTNLTQYKDFFRNEYAAGTPITLWYQLAEPKTETFIAPQIPTLNGTTVIDVDTKVEPSNIYIKYKSSK